MLERRNTCVVCRTIWKHPARNCEFRRWWNEVPSTMSPENPHHIECDGFKKMIPKKETFAAVHVATNYVARASRECQTHDVATSSGGLHVDQKQMSGEPDTSRGLQKSRLPSKSELKCPQTTCASNSAEATQTASVGQQPSCLL